MNWLMRKIIIAKINGMRKGIEKGGDIMKPGIFTSEFYVTLVSGIIVAVCNAFKVSPDIRDAIVKLAIAYIASRTAVKVSNGIKKQGE